MQDSYHLELTKKGSLNKESFYKFIYTNTHLYIPIFVTSIPLVLLEFKASFGLLLTGKSMSVKSSQKNIFWPSSKRIREHTTTQNED